MFNPGRASSIFSNFSLCLTSIYTDQIPDVNIPTIPIKNTNNRVVAILAGTAIMQQTDNNGLLQTAVSSALLQSVFRCVADD